MNDKSTDTVETRHFHIHFGFHIHIQRVIEFLFQLHGPVGSRQEESQKTMLFPLLSASEQDTCCNAVREQISCLNCGNHEEDVTTENYFQASWGVHPEVGVQN